MRLTPEGFGRYAHPERERRFLLDRVPDGARLAWTIVDKYLDGTRLRLRRAESPGGEVLCKFGQKIRPDEADPSLVMLTNLYLSETEFRALDALSGAVLTKRRHVVPAAAHTVAVDEFGGALAGLVLAEASFAGDRELREFAPPAWFGPEVTADDRFSGGSLARAAGPPEGTA